MATSPYASLYTRRLGPYHFAYLRPIAEGLEPLEMVPAMVLARLSGDLCPQVIRLRQRDPEGFLNKKFAQCSNLVKKSTS